jgi:hypothetical protein
MIISGNPTYGLCEQIKKIYPDLICVSRSSNDINLDLTKQADQLKFAALSVEHDCIVLCSALWKFNQTVLLHEVYKANKEANKSPLIICIGSTTDRVKKGTDWLYNAEKKALRDYCNSLSISGVWSGGPRVTLVSFGSLSNVQHKHPTRKCIDITKAAQYIQWITEQPSNLHVNEISIDAMQL